MTRRHALIATACALALPARPARAIADAPDALIVWPGGGPFFGGFSAIEVSDDRTQMLALSDRGFGVRALMLRDADGRLRGVEKTDHFSLSDARGAPLEGPRADAEGMDLRPDGTLFVSFEGGRNRVVRYDDPRGPARALPRADDWAALPGNAGLEALAIDARGRPHVLTETPQDQGFAVYRLTGDRWEVLGHVPARDGYAPVGADFGPDGMLYLLERKFRLLFSSRISRLRPGAWDQPETLVETGYGALDNHEGLSVTRDARGQLWATTISDDNRNRFQRTEIAEFRLS